MTSEARTSVTDGAERPDTVRQAQGGRVAAGFRGHAISCIVCGGRPFAGLRLHFLYSVAECLDHNTDL